jgi:hypothetical protein
MYSFFLQVVPLIRHHKNHLRHWIIVDKLLRFAKNAGELLLYLGQFDTEQFVVGRLAEDTHVYFRTNRVCSLLQVYFVLQYWQK